MRAMKRHFFPLIFALFIAFPVYMLFFDRVPPYQELAVRVLTPNAERGGFFRFELTGRVARHCDGIVRRELVDAEDKVHSIVAVRPMLTGQIGKDYTFERAVPVPSGMALGPASYFGYAFYECNPLQWRNPIRLPPTVARFNVVEKTSRRSLTITTATAGEPGIGAGAAGMAQGAAGGLP